jgi:hypothetical protein
MVVHGIAKGARHNLIWSKNMSANFKVISGAVPSTLGEVVNFNFGLPSIPKGGVGMLFYMVDTREGDHVYRVEMNGNTECKIALPKGNNFATLNTPVGHLGQANVLSFETDGDGPP